MSGASALVLTPILRTASGEPPLGRDATFFRDDQGEIFEHDNPRYRSAATKIGVLALDNGKWLAQPPSFHVSRPHYDSRDQALRAGIAALLRRARKYMRNGEGEGTHWNEGFASRVMEWALSLKPARKTDDATGEPPAPTPQPEQDFEQGARSNGGSPVASETWCDTLTDQMAHDELCVAGYEASDAGAELSDPVVKYLVEQHGLRQQFPAKHIFSMTTEVADGRIVSVATCSCKQVVLKFGSNDYLRMNAAIEAHWRRFPHEPTVDGRGQPIGAKAKKTSNKKVKAASPCDHVLDLLAQAESSDGGVDGHPASGSVPWSEANREAGTETSGPSEQPAPSDAKRAEGAGSPEPQAAPIGAGDEYLAGIAAKGRLDDLGSVQDGRKMSTDGQPALGDSAGAVLRDCASPQATAAPALALSAIMEMLAGALRCAATGLPSGERTTIRFTNEWEHLGSHTISGILDLANEILEAAPQAELVSPPRRRQAAQICASEDSSAAWDDLPAEVRAQAEADGTDELLKAALSLTWTEPEPPVRKPKGPMQLPDGRLVGPDEYMREIAKQKLKDEPVHLGPLFSPPPPTTT